MNYPPFLSADPMDLEIEPGMRVRDLSTPEECASALVKIDADIGKILSQISRHEADPDSKPKGWRSKAQGAIRWKKQARKAVVAYAATIGAGGLGRPKIDDRRQAILNTIEEEVGRDEFERLVALAKGRHPELWGAS